MASRAVLYGASQHGLQGVGGPYLIKHGNDIVNLQWYTSHTAAVAAMPFDGFVFDAKITNNVNIKVHSTVAVSFAQCQTDLAGHSAALSSFGTCTKNFPRVVLTDATSNLDWWNDTSWATVTANWTNFAQAAKAQNCHGLCFDPEWYGPTTSSNKGPWDWATQTGAGVYGDSGPDNPAVVPIKGCDTAHILSATRAQAHLRGKQVMNGILSQWNNVRFLVLHGPTLSSYLTAAAVGAGYFDLSWANEILGCFESGLMAAINEAGNKALLIDGGEMYSLRTQADFQRATNWKLSGLSHARSGAIDSSTWGPNWKAVNGFGIYDLDILNSNADFSSSTYQNLVTYAMRSAAYTWMFTQQYDWWGSGLVPPTTPVPAGWVTAMTNARIAGRL